MELKHVLWCALTSTALCYGLSAQAASYNALKDTYLSKDSKNANYGSQSSLSVSKDNRGILQFDIDNTPNFGTECNLTTDYEKVELVVNLGSVANCGNNCALEVRSTDSFNEASATWSCPDDSNLGNDSADCDPNWNGGKEGPKIGEVEVTNGQTGEARIDITSYVKSLDQGSFVINLLLRQKHSGEVSIVSKEGGTAARIEVTRTAIPEAEAAGLRKTITVNGITMSYLDSGPSSTERVFVFVHGMPAHSYMFRNMFASLSEYGRVVAPDLTGSGFSGRPPVGENAGEFTYRYGSDPTLPINPNEMTHAKQLGDFIDALGLINIILLAHENGGLTALHYAATHPSNIAGVILNEPWVDFCPPDLEALGACSSLGIVFGDLRGYWAACIHPDSPLVPGICPTDTPLYPWTNGCNALRGYATDFVIQNFLTARTLTAQEIANYQQPWGDPNLFETKVCLSRTSCVRMTLRMVCSLKICHQVHSMSQFMQEIFIHIT